MPISKVSYPYANDTLQLPTAVVNSRLSVNGSSLFSGTIDEFSTFPGLHAGVLNGTPRLMFAPPGSTSSANNWQIDVVAGRFRWFTPGVEQMSLINSTLTINNIVSSGSVSIGTSATNIGKVAIVNTSTALVPLVIRAAAGQTADTFKIQDSAATDLLSVSDDGNLVLTAGLSVSGGSSAGTVGKFFTYSHISSGTLPSANTLVLKTSSSSASIGEPFIILNNSNAPVFEINSLGEITNQNNNFVPLTVRATPNTSTNITGITANGTTVTYNTGVANNNIYPTGSTVTITGATTAGYNGTFTVTGAPTSASFTVANTTVGTTSTATAVIAAQVSDLTQWKSQAGSVIAKVDASGNLTAVGGTFSSTISASGLAGSLLSSASPVVNGTAAAGTSAIPSRQDHVHPTDTSRAATANPSISTSLSVSGASLGGTATNETIVQNISLTTSNVDYIKTKWRRISTGADWQTAQAKIQRTVDTTDMGYIGFGGTNIYDVRIGSAVTDIATFAPTAITLSQAVTASSTLTTGGALNLNYASPAITSNNASAASIFTSTVTGVTIGSSTIKSTNYPAAPSGTTSGTVTQAAQLSGYIGMPQNPQATSGTFTYTFAASDAGKHIYATGTPSSVTFTIPANSAVSFEIGTTFVVMNDLGAATNISIAITTDTLQLAGTGTTGTRTLARYGVASITKVTSTKWIISGNGLT